VTLVTSVKFVPVIVMLVPPAIGPVAGLTAVTVIEGGGGFGAPLSLQARLPRSRVVAMECREADSIHPPQVRDRQRMN
jgi:hypothetical protein